MNFRVAFGYQKHKDQIYCFRNYCHTHFFYKFLNFTLMHGMKNAIRIKWIAYILYSLEWSRTTVLMYPSGLSEKTSACFTKASLMVSYPFKSITGDVPSLIVTRSPYRFRSWRYVSIFVRSSPNRLPSNGSPWGPGGRLFFLTSRRYQSRQVITTTRTTAKTYILSKYVLAKQAHRVYVKDWQLCNNWCINFKLYTNGSIHYL